MDTTPDKSVPGTSLMDNPEVAAEAEQAVNYSELAGRVVDPVRPGGLAEAEAESSIPLEPKVDAFEGFMSISRYMGAAIVLVVFWSTIYFAMGGSALWTALSTLGLGLALTAALKLRGTFVALMILFSLITVPVIGVLGWMTADGVDTAPDADMQIGDPGDS